MRRRVALVLRLGLLGVGGLLLLVLPVSAFRWGAFEWESKHTGVGAYASRGVIRGWLAHDDGWERAPMPLRFTAGEGAMPTGGSVVFPTVGRSAFPARVGLQFTIPLWLPAAVCLAWPATSFVVAWRRRRRGPGFEVAAGGRGRGRGRGRGLG